MEIVTTKGKILKITGEFNSIEGLLVEVSRQCQPKKVVGLVIGNEPCVKKTGPLPTDPQTIVAVIDVTKPSTTAPSSTSIAGMAHQNLINMISGVPGAAGNVRGNVETVSAQRDISEAKKWLMTQRISVDNTDLPISSQKINAFLRTLSEKSNDILKPLQDLALAETDPEAELQRKLPLSPDDISVLTDCGIDGENRKKRALYLCDLNVSEAIEKCMMSEDGVSDDPFTFPEVLKLLYDKSVKNILGVRNMDAQTATAMILMYRGDTRKVMEACTFNSPELGTHLAVVKVTLLLMVVQGILKAKEVLELLDSCLKDPQSVVRRLRRNETDDDVRTRNILLKIIR